MWARFILLMMALLLSSVAKADPAIWQVKGKHNTLYLLGTVHLLPTDEQLPANIRNAYGEAEQLLMEIDMDDMDPLTTQGLMMQLGLLPEGEDLLTQLDAATQRKLQTTASNLGFDTRVLSRFQPWLAAMMLEQLQFAKLGFSATSGIEMRLTEQAAQDRKEIAGLETLQEQLNFFAQMKPSAQRDYLRQTLDEMQESPQEIQEMLGAWRKGDISHLQGMLNEALADSPELMMQLTTQRNQRWLVTLKQLLESQSDDYLVAVGALHLVGDQGLVTLLKRAGYSITLQ